MKTYMQYFMDKNSIMWMKCFVAFRAVKIN